MDKMMALAEQHALEWASHLRHIDELIAQARSAPKEHATDIDGILRPIEESRHRLARDIDALKQSSPSEEPDSAARGAGLTDALKALGFQLEQVLVGIFDAPVK